jgi:ssDNA-specific exonuclease RecJ
MNKEKVQYVIRAMRLNEKYMGEYLSEKEEYTRFIQKGGAEINPENIPGREDFKSVYIFLLNLLGKNTMHDSPYNINRLQNQYFDSSHRNMTRFKFRVILDIFSQTGIICAELDFERIKKIKINSQTGKIDLEASEIYKRLKGLL